MSLGYAGLSVFLTLTRSTTETIAVSAVFREKIRKNNNNDKINAAPRQSLMNSLNKKKQFGFSFPPSSVEVYHTQQLAHRLRQSLHNEARKLLCNMVGAALPGNGALLSQARSLGGRLTGLVQSAALTVGALSDWVPPRRSRLDVSWTAPGSPSWQRRPRCSCAWPCPRPGWCACTGRCTRQTRGPAGRSCSLSR